MQQLTTKQIKKHQTNIKSGVGAFGMSLIMTLVYLVKALLGHNFNFYFSNYIPEVLLKSASFTRGYNGVFSAVFTENWQGKLPLVWFCVGFAVYAAVCIALVVLAGKHPPLIWAAFALHLCDTVLLVLGRWQGIPNGFEETVLIDGIFHLLVLLFLLVGGISGVVLPKDKRGDPREDMTDFIVKVED